MTSKQRKHSKTRYVDDDDDDRIWCVVFSLFRNEEKKADASFVRSAEIIRTCKKEHFFGCLSVSTVLVSVNIRVLRPYAECLVQCTLCIRIEIFMKRI